jgi:hypothetical protein
MGRGVIQRAPQVVAKIRANVGKPPSLMDMLIRQLAAALFASGCIVLTSIVVDADPSDCTGTATINGIAVDPAGHAVPNVGIHVEPADHASGASTMTGSDGTFHFACLPPGGAYIEAGTETLAATPQVIDVPRGKKAFLRFEMVATIIAGIVTTADGAPVAHAKVSVHDPLDGANNTGEDVEVDGHGHFVIRAMPPGRYHLEVHRDNLVAQRVVTTSDDNLKLELVPAIAPSHAR